MTTTANTRVAVVGGGVAGMAAAVRMAVAGYRVDLFEAAPHLGGKLSEHRQGEFRFDCGPSLFTMPELLEELFQLAGRKLEDYLVYERLPLVCRYFYPDQTVVDAWADPKKFAQELALKTGASEQAVDRYLKRAALIYETTTPVFLEASLHDWQQYARREVALGLLRMPLLGTQSTLHRFNTQWLKAPKAVQLFDRFATYNGSDPYRAPATLMQIAHIEHGKGAFYPKGGMIALRNAIEKLLLELGVQIHKNSPVESLLLEGKQVKGIQLQGRSLEFDKVIFAGDIHQFYKRLLPDSKSKKSEIETNKLSTSALIFQWGMRSTFSQLDLHNIFFSANYEAEFAALKAAKLHQDPTIYVYISSKHNPEDSPAGGENWFVMINTPPDSGQNWTEWSQKWRRFLIDKLSKALGVPIENYIVEEHCITPPDIGKNTAATAGSIYGLASNTKWTAFLRHANFSRRYQGLYFVGGSVHPGGGIPLCLLSARIVDQWIQRHA